MCHDAHTMLMNHIRVKHSNSKLLLLCDMLDPTRLHELAIRKFAKLEMPSALCNSHITAQRAVVKSGLEP
jgi:hypothetical protein